MQPSFIFYQHASENQPILSFESSWHSIFQKYKSGQTPTSSAFKLYSTDVSSLSDSEETPSNDMKIRGSYRKYTKEEKELAVFEVVFILFQILNGHDVKEVSKKYGIPRRNLLRWRKNGCQRKEGGGRPTDIDMENILYDKIKKQ